MKNKMRMNKVCKKLFICNLLGLIMCGCGKVEKTEEVFSICELHNGDAKFLNDHIITNVGNILTLINFQGEIEKTYPEVQANWIDVLEDENVIIYGNFSNDMGVVRLDPDYEIISNDIVMHTDNLQIDPSILKVDNCYYVTATEIEGNVNNGDPSVDNGLYTVHLFSSKDLNSFTKVSDIVSAYHNIEDVDLINTGNELVLCYEEEMVDKGDSAIKVILSTDASGKEWGISKTLLDAECDHEPVDFEIYKNKKWRLYYSSDLKDKGKSYMAGNCYFADFDNNFEPISVDNLISTSTETGILWYDLTNFDGKKYYLFAKDYLSTCDMVLEKSK